MKRSLTLWQRIVCAVTFLATSAFVSAQMKKPMTPETCTSMHYLASDVTSRSPLQLSPDGSRVAYVLQVPDVAANDNEETLYVSAVDGTSSAPPMSVMSDELITALHWFPDNRTIAVLTRRNGKIVLEQIDTATNKEDLIWEADSNVDDYSMDASGEIIAVAVSAGNRLARVSATRQDESTGYRLDPESTDGLANSPKRNIYILQLGSDHRWALSRRVEFTSPLSGKLIRDVEDNHALHINLSPNGRYLLLDNDESFSNIPPRKTWEESPLVRFMKTRGFAAPYISYLYDIQTGTASMPLESPYVLDGMWAPDSKSFIKIAAAPVGSRWEASDFVSEPPSNHVTHMFAVNVATGEVSEVLRRAETTPLAWKNGDLVIRTSPDELVTLREAAGSWKQVATQKMPFTDAMPYSAISSDGNRVVMEYENVRTAPRLVGLDLHSSHTWNVAELDPQADDLILPQTETVSWTTPSGFTAKGMLLLPPNYDPRHRYPLVIEDGSFLYSGEFVCDSGPAHVPSFARGILADAGVAYLMRFWPGNSTWENMYYSKKYPGQLAEAAFKQELVESAVDMLTQRQIIDPEKVGLIGFSRGGWYVDYALTHSQISFRAASTTDGTQYSIGEYYLWHDKPVSATLKTMYGGPPYGGSLDNWIKFSISFNMDKVHTPLLIEVMGRGKKAAESDNLDTKEEVFDGLSDLKKPVELYYYPNEEHQSDHPQARLFSLQRNVDWFRFWLQDYERPNPEDPNQYKRWEAMRSEQSRNVDPDKAAASAAKMAHR